MNIRRNFPSLRERLPSACEIPTRFNVQRDCRPRYAPSFPCSVSPRQRAPLAAYRMRREIAQLDAYRRICDSKTLFFCEAGGWIEAALWEVGAFAATERIAALYLDYGPLKYPERFPAV